jgi:pSer/pThr/pTyr-binding forkhead associated (FHA) protein
MIVDVLRGADRGEQEAKPSGARDLGSKNGSFVNRARVEVVPLADREVVRLGDWVGVVCCLPDEALQRGTLLARRLLAAAEERHLYAAGRLG